MCLSTAYKNNKDDSAVLARYVSQVQVQPGKVILTDIVGAETVVEGELSYIDLTGGVVVIRTDAA